MESNPATVAALLSCASAESLGTVQLAKKLRIGPARLIALVRELSCQGLVEVVSVSSRTAGRPMAEVRLTFLGLEYLAAYRAMASKTLKSRPSDLRRAVSDAEYARRLVMRGVSTNELFLELNSLVEPIRRPSS